MSVMLNCSITIQQSSVFQYVNDNQVLITGPARDLGGQISRMEVSLAALSDWFCANALK